MEAWQEWKAGWRTAKYGKKMAKKGGGLATPERASALINSRV